MVLINALLLGITNPKNNTRACTAVTASKTRTKLNVIKIRYIFGSTLGLAQPLTASTTVPSTHRPQYLLRPTTTPPNSNLHHRASSWLSIHADTVVNNFQTILLLIGMPVLLISPMFTNSASAISPRSSSVPITSVNTSSTAMPAPVGNGLTCWRRHA